MILIKKSPSHKHFGLIPEPMRIFANPCPQLEQKHQYSQLVASLPQLYFRLYSFCVRFNIGVEL